MRRVLYADGRCKERSIWQRLLGPHCRLQTVATEAEAIAALDDETADIVITSWQLEQGDGASLLAQVAERWPDTDRLAVVDGGRWIETPYGLAKSMLPRHPNTKSLIRKLGLDRRRSAATAGSIEVVAEVIELEPSRPPPSKATG